jgi:hypothetical protein
MSGGLGVPKAKLGQMLVSVGVNFVGGAVDVVLDQHHAR